MFAEAVHRFWQKPEPELSLPLDASSASSVQQAGGKRARPRVSPVVCPPRVKLTANSSSPKGYHSSHRWDSDSDGGPGSTSSTPTSVDSSCFAAVPVVVPPVDELPSSAYTVHAVRTNTAGQRRYVLAQPPSEYKGSVLQASSSHKRVKLRRGPSIPHTQSTASVLSAHCSSGCDPYVAPTRKAPPSIGSASTLRVCPPPAARTPTHVQSSATSAPRGVAMHCGTAKVKKPKKLSKRQAANEEFRSVGRAFFTRFWEHDDAWPFHDTVDPVLWRCPEYYSIVRHPIAMPQIQHRLHTDHYIRQVDQRVKSSKTKRSKNCVAKRANGKVLATGHSQQPHSRLDMLWDLLYADFRLMLENALSFNPKGTEVYNATRRLVEDFPEIKTGEVLRTTLFSVPNRQARLQRKARNIPAAVVRRLGRRGGRVPAGWPSSWFTNARFKRHHAH